MGYGIALILTALWTTSAWGNIIIMRVDGASGFNAGNAGPQGTIVNTNNPSAVSTTPTIFAGAAGFTGTSTCDSTVGTQNGDGTCNTCAGKTSLVACNTKAVYPSLQLTITYRSTTLTGFGLPLLMDVNGVAVPMVTYQSVNGPNQDGSITVLWQNMCTAAGSDSSCSIVPSTSSALTLGFDTQRNNTFADQVQIQIGIATPTTGTDDTIDYCGPPLNTTVNSSGVCAFRAFPGDNKVYLIDLLPGSTFPVAGGGTSTNVQMNALMLFYSTDGFQFVHAGTPNPKSFEIRLNSNVANSNVFDVVPNKASGLDNGVDYFFRLATVDQASNVAFFTSDTAINEACASVDPTAATSLFPPLSDAALQGCPFVARPDKVNGLLTKDFNCFIASAAYGSVLDSRLKVFRAFRGLILLRSSWGRAFNQMYYKYGPYGARFLNENPWIKPVVRVTLWPALLFAKLSLDVGMVTASILMILLTLFVVMGVWKLRPRILRV